MDRQTAKIKAEELVSRMTVEEAASQLRYDAPAIERLGIPAYNWWSEALHGVARAGTATSFPQSIALAAAFDPDMMRRIGTIVSTEGRAMYNENTKRGDRDIFKGLTFWSPNVNIFRDPRWGRGQETFGEDPYLTSELGAAYMKGLQGEGDVLRSAACAKHFAVHSGPEALRHSFDAKASEKDMAETYLPAFKRLVDEGVEAVMGAYNRTNGEPSCASRDLMRRLRGDWGFEGHFVSDCWAIRDFHENHKVTARPEESVTLALKTGCDVNCGCTYQFVMNAYREGLITEEDIRRSAVRLFTTRYRLGIMGEGSEYDAIGYECVESSEHLAAARKVAEKCCVLLKNDGLLPLNKDSIKTIGVIGPNANNRTALIGNYHGTSSRYITVLEGIQRYVGDDVRVMFSEGSHLFKDRVEPLAVPDDRVAEAQTVAAHSDVVVLVVGLDETLEGEEGDTGNAAASGDKIDLLLPAGQRRMIDAVLDMGKPTVVCLMAGSSIDLGDAADRANAVLLGWYPGAQGGAAIADILFGEVSPSGKLPVTFYKNEQLDEMPAFTDYAMRGRTYRYIEKEPLYPFGYGLTYGKCAVTEAKKTEVGTSITITNQSLVSTSEVVQIYAQNEGSPDAPRNPRLVAFKRIECPAEGSVSCEIEIPSENLYVIDGDGKAVQAGQLVFYAGLGQPDARTEALTGCRAVRFE